MTYLTITEAAERMNVSPRRIQQLCKEGAIEGVIKEGRSWRIPADTAIPVREKTQEPDEIMSYMLPVPIGVSDYIEMESLYYYVDKTLMIREFIETLPKLSLFTRPMRFGKSLNMDMMRVFFEKSDSDTAVYFRNRKIWQCGSRFTDWQGKYPVLRLSFGDVNASTYPEAITALCKQFRTEIDRHGELQADAPYTDSEKELVYRFMNGQADESNLQSAISMLCAMLHRFHGQTVMIFIDAYDTPLICGRIYGYFDQMQVLLTRIMTDAFHENACMSYGFLSGISGEAGVGAFRNAPQLAVHSIYSQRYAPYFGLTADEVAELLHAYNRDDCIDEINEWYGGYRIGGTAFFNPGSVMQYLYENLHAKPYLSDGMLKHIMDEMPDDPLEMQQTVCRLMRGESVATTPSNELFTQGVSAFARICTALLSFGYLQVKQIKKQYDGGLLCDAVIVNKELAFLYCSDLMSRVLPERAVPVAVEMRQAVYRNDIAALKDEMCAYLSAYIDSSAQLGDRLFDQLTAGLFAVLYTRYTVSSEFDRIAGRLELRLQPNADKLPGFLIAMKESKRDTGDLAFLAGSLLDQLIRISFRQEAGGIPAIIRIGMAYRGTESSIAEG